MKAFAKHDKPALNSGPPRGKRHGAVLVTTLVCMTFIMVMGAAVLSQTLSGLMISRRVQRDVLSFNLAESGIDRALRWIKNQSSPPSNTSAFDPLGGAQSMDGGTYSVLVTPDPANSGAVLKKYKIVATGTYSDQFEKVELYVHQSSFGKYAYFTDQETSSITGGRIWFYSGDRIKGPAHSNNRNGSDFQINWGGSAAPIFEGLVTSVSTDINFAPADPTTESQFSQVFRAGSRGYELGVSEIPMPSSTDQQKVAAWGPNGSYPASTGVYVPAGGGIYIRGNSTMQLLVDAQGNQQFKVVQGATTTTLTIDVPNNRIGKQIGAGATTYTTGIGNGMVYSTGTISNLNGTIADNRVSNGVITNRSTFTIATDAAQDITISDNVKYKTAYDATKDPDAPANLLPGTLGLVSGDVKVQTGAPNNLEIDAVVMAGGANVTGSFSVEDYNTKQPTGKLKVVGGIIQQQRGPVGTLGSGGFLNTGYAKNYNYDARMADNPPPYFPTTGGYDRLSWRRLIG